MSEELQQRRLELIDKLGRQGALPPDRQKLWDRRQEILSSLQGGQSRSMSPAQRPPESDPALYDELTRRGVINPAEGPEIQGTMNPQDLKDIGNKALDVAPEVAGVAGGLLPAMAGAPSVGVALAPAWYAGAKQGVDMLRGGLPKKPQPIQTRQGEAASIEGPGTQEMAIDQEALQKSLEDDLKIGIKGELTGQLMEAPFLIGPKLLAPFKKTMEKAAKGDTGEYVKMAAEMSEKGAPLSLADWHPSWLARGAALFSENIFPGRLVNDLRLRNVTEWLINAKNELVKDRLNLPDAAKAHAEMVGRREELYNNAIQAAGADESIIPMLSLEVLLEKHADKPVAKELRRRMEKYMVDGIAHVTPRQLLKKGQYGTATQQSVETGLLRTAMDWVSSKTQKYGYKNMTKPERELRDKLKDAIMEDIEEFDKMSGKQLRKDWKAADKYYAMTVNAATPESASILLNDGLMRSTVREKGKEFFLPKNFRGWLRKNRGTLERQLSPEQMATVDRFAEEAMLATDDVWELYQKTMSPRKTAMKEIKSGVGSAVGTLAIGGGTALMTPKLAVPLGFAQYWGAKSLAKPNGYLQRMFRDGIGQGLPATVSRGTGRLAAKPAGFVLGESRADDE